VAPLAPNDMLAAHEVAEIVEYVGQFRTNADTFDIAVTGSTPDDKSLGSALVSLYSAAGATWWLEDISPWRYGWDWHGEWPFSQMERRIRMGPPGK